MTGQIAYGILQAMSPTLNAGLKSLLGDRHHTVHGKWVRNQIRNAIKTIRTIRQWRERIRLIKFWNVS